MPNNESLSLDEKASLTSGAGWWNTVAFAGRSIPEITMADGPHGVRYQEADADHLGVGNSAPSTCFPPAVGLGSSWDRELTQRIAVALAHEAQSFGINLLLGPGINIKRSLLCGRNFEYFSEDPLLSAELGVAWVNGLQGEGVGASLKHFAVNNQESERMIVSANVAPRPLQEIYLRAFRRVVTDAKPWTVMCSYNRINGVHASENSWLLTDVLRHDWGFDGAVISDWGAVVDRVKALAAGMDLEMPTSSGQGPAAVASAVRTGALPETLLDQSVQRLITLARISAENARPRTPFDADAHHDLAREAATRSAVLLKNETDLLPLDPTSGQKIAVIGEFARNPRYQGAGSSKVVPTRLDSAWNAISELIDATTGPDASTVHYAPGFTTSESAPSEQSITLLDEAISLAADCDVVVLFLGLPASYESEGFDREHIDLPGEQTALIEAIAAANSRVVVVLSNGAVVRVSGWVDRVPAILESWLLGQAGGSALADLLFGKASPSGKLAETIPLRLEDTPAYLNFPGESRQVEYGEGLFVGYRHYDARKMDVSFPFGHGLSYTTFTYSSPAVRHVGEDIEITLTVRNAGRCTGREIVQAYARTELSRVQRPDRELKGFAVTDDLEPGEAQDLTIVVPRRELEYFDASEEQWLVESLNYRFDLGASSRDIRLSVEIPVTGDPYEPRLDKQSTIRAWFSHPVGGPALRKLLAPVLASVEAEAPAGSNREKAIMGTRLGQLAKFSMVPVNDSQLDALVHSVNS